MALLGFFKLGFRCWKQAIFFDLF